MVMYNLGKVTVLGLPEWEALGQDELEAQVDLKHTEGESVYITLSPPCTATLIAKNRTELVSYNSAFTFTLSSCR